jgi:hypothetical protein
MFIFTTAQQLCVEGYELNALTTCSNHLYRPVYEGRQCVSQYELCRREESPAETHSEPKERFFFVKADKNW